MALFQRGRNSAEHDVPSLDIDQLIAEELAHEPHPVAPRRRGRSPSPSTTSSPRTTGAALLSREEVQAAQLVDEFYREEHAREAEERLRSERSVLDEPRPPAGRSAAGMKAAPSGHMKMQDNRRVRPRNDRLDSSELDAVVDEELDAMLRPQGPAPSASAHGGVHSASRLSRGDSEETLLSNLSMDEQAALDEELNNLEGSGWEPPPPAGARPAGGRRGRTPRRSS